MRRYGLIGQSLRHSFSQQYFTQKFAQENRFDCQYELYELPDLSRFKDFLQSHPDLFGLNVTIPYKQQIIPLLDDIDAEAERVGAINTVRVFHNDGTTRTVGYNTDVVGFRLSLAEHPLPDKALVLGTGGASAAVMHVLHSWNVDCKQVSRTKKNGALSYADLSPSIIAENRMIVNCTPLGMFPNVNTKPDIPYEALTNRHFLYDLVYNPEETEFLREGRLRGAQIQNGYQMLVLQAEASWKIWNASQRQI